MKKNTDLFENVEIPGLKKLIRIMKLTTFFILISVGCVFASQTYSQTKTINQEVGQQSTVSGIVLDEFGQPMPGVNVFVKGTTNGTITNIDGEYLLSSIPENATLVFSFIGMSTQEIVVGTQTQINLTMATDAIGLEEVVAVGYGTMRKSDLTGAVASVNSDKLGETKGTSTLSAIQGQVAGVNITRTSNKPGGGYDIQIRGVNSLGNANASTPRTPLFVVDGVILASIDHLNPSDIKKIDILKDASSASIYGSRGANGVMIITTNSGKKGKATVSYDGYFGIKSATNLPDMMNTEEFATYAMDFERISNGNPNPQLSDVFGDDEIANINNNYHSVDWLDEIMELGIQTNHTITISGGDDKMIYSFSAGYQKDEGVIGMENTERYTLRNNMTRTINEKLKFGVNINTSFVTSDRGSSEGLRTALRMSPAGNVYDENGELDFSSMNREPFLINPLLDLKNEYQQDESFHAYGNFNINYKPIESLEFISSFSPNFYQSRDGIYRGQDTKHAKGQASRTQSHYNPEYGISYTWDNILKFSKTIGRHDIKVTAIGSQYKNRSEGLKSRVHEYSTDSQLWYNAGAAGKIHTLDTWYRMETLLSFMLRGEYRFNNKYLLTLAGRYDGSSKLSTGNKWSFFPSVALGWRISEEGFLADSETISNLKLRLGYGEIGNNVVEPYSSLQQINNIKYSFGDDINSGVQVANLENTALTWEITKEFNLGLDYGFLNNKISGSVELYRRNSEGIILDRNIAAINGFESVIQNVGSIRNTGIEISLNTVNVSSKDFSWTTGLTFTTNKNEIVDILGDKEDNIGNKWFIGQPVNVEYDYDYLRPWRTNEAAEAASYGRIPGDGKVVDHNNDGSVDSGDRVVLGQKDPKGSVGLTNTFKYKGFDLNFFLDYRYGMVGNSQIHQKFGSTWEGPKFNHISMDYWTPENEDAEWPRPGSRSVEYRGGFTMPLDYLKIRYITLGYTLSSETIQKAGFSKARVYFTAQNPFTFSKYKQWDPETATANTWGFSPSTRTLMLGFNLIF